jgi:hypothetical protein
VNRSVHSRQKHSTPGLELTAATSYGDAVLARARSSDNFNGAPITLAQLGAHLGVSGEHMRRIALRGSALISPKLNEGICGALHLDRHTMWATNVRERALHKARQIAAMFGVESEEVALLKAFARLGGDERKCLIKLLESGFSAARSSVQTCR